MPVKPNSQTLTHNGVDILNAIRNNAKPTDPELLLLRRTISVTSATP